MNWRGFFAALAIAFLLPSNASGQIQQAWVAHYNNHFTVGQHQATKTAIGADGNIVICGFSANASNELGYAVVKYAPNGRQLWVARLDSTNVAQATPSDFAVDPSNNIIVTGNAGTVKFGGNGAEMWWQPYNGTSITTDTNGNVFITGFGSNFNTVKLSSDGTTILWRQTYTDVGPTVGEKVVVDAAGNAYVAGLDVWFQMRSETQQGLLVTEYSPTGSLLWKFFDRGSVEDVLRVGAIALDTPGDLFVLFDGNNNGPFTTDKISGAGTLVWQSPNPTDDVASVSHGLALLRGGAVCETGAEGYIPDSAYGTYGISSNGALSWGNTYPSATPTSVSVAEAVAADPLGTTIYVTGYSPGATISNDIVTIAYDTNGKQLWLQRYDGPAHGDDEGNAIAVDNSGNVYVAGYDTPIGGGTEMVLIKYSPVTVKHEANGDFQLQAQGAANEPFDIQASTNLSSWIDLGDYEADTNGLLQFIDTNAGQFPQRFYQAIPQ